MQNLDWQNQHENERIVYSRRIDANKSQCDHHDEKFRIQLDDL